MSDLIERLRERVRMLATPSGGDTVIKLFPKEVIKIADALEAKDQRIKRLEALLKVAKCPDPGCDGKGTVCRGEYQHENGEVEYDLEQCRWCDERDAALDGEKPQAGCGCGDPTHGCMAALDGEK